LQSYLKMTRLKTLSIFFVSLAMIYSFMTHLGGQFANQAKLCQNIIFKALQPWDSACFYSAIFQPENILSDLHYEKHHLDLFFNNGGYSPAIKWYRSVFFRKYKDVFDITNDQIAIDHWALMRSQPYNLQAQINYLIYLDQEHPGKKPQSALNEFCTLFVKPGGDNAPPVEALEWLINESDLKLDMKYCKSRIS
jgi:hypothetical protein